MEKGIFELEGLLEKPKATLRYSSLPQARSILAAFMRPSMWISAVSAMARPLTWFREGTETKQQPLRRTAYLDGLRGFAALLVYSLHHQVWGHSGIMGEFILENAYGYHEKYYFVCLPFIRILFSGGHLAVAVFFVISGYVLSAKPLTYVQSREPGQLADNVGSALFRRWVRLFLPVLATTFIWMTSWHVFGIRNHNPIADAPESNYFDEVWKWYCDFKNYSFIFHGEILNKYNDHTWSIPLEFRGSIVVYTSVLAFARCRTSLRLCLYGVLIFYFLYIVDGWFCGLFAVGMLLSDIDLLAAKDQLPQIFSYFRPTQSWMFYAMMVVGLYLGGVPSIAIEVEHLQESPGWYLLSFLKPQAAYDFRCFFRFWAASFVVAAIPQIPRIKAFFETSLCQYLGRISFSFYLVHGPVLWTLGDRIYAATGRVREGHKTLTPGWINLLPFPSWGPFGLEVNYLVAHLILLPVTLWLAEVVTRLIDEPSLKFSQWLFDRSSGTKRGHERAGDAPLLRLQ